MSQQLYLWPSEPPQPSAVPPAPAYQKSPRKLLTIRELPPSERPLSRLHRYGPAALSSSELLAILIGTPHQLQDAAHLLAARIKAAFELGRRLPSERRPDHSQIRSPADAANLLMAEMGLLEQNARHPHSKWILTTW